MNRFWEEGIDSGSIPDSEAVFDAIVVGGGPGGSAAASYLALEGKKVLLIEKFTWPRDKVCGDAVGGKSLSHVKALGVKEELEATPHFRVTGIRFSSPNGNSVRVALPEEDVERLEAGYSLPRKRFDWLMFNRANELVLENGGAVVQNCTVRSAIVEEGRIKGVKAILKDDSEVFWFSKWTVGAGGYQCPVARTIIKDVHNEELVDRNHYCGGYREYWRGVKGCEGNVGDIEIHFVDSIAPGYFWIFPTSENISNVGIGVVLSELDGKDTKLKAMQADVINNHRLFKQRFSEAEMIQGSARGWQLPFGSPRKKAELQPRRMQMPGALLIGDAASLVDPFSGEGIGNALLSAEIAAKHILEDIGGKAYQDEVWKELGAELTNSYKMQRMSRKKWLLNWFVGKAAKKKKLQELMTEMIASKEAQGNLHSKWFLLRTLLF